MSIQDRCCTIVPYFKVSNSHMAEFKQFCEECVVKTREEGKCLYYGFSFHDNIVHCREGYEDAEGLLAHLENVGELLQSALKISELERLEVHGPEEELAKLREPLDHLKPQFFILEYGFRK